MPIPVPVGLPAADENTRRRLRNPTMPVETGGPYCCVQECPQQPSPPKPVAIIARPARCCAGRSLAFGSAPASRANAHARHTKRTKKSPTNRRSRADLAALPAHGFAAQSRPQMRGIPTAQTCRHEGSQTIDPTIQDPAAAAQRLSAAYPNRPGISRSEHAKPGRAPCVARRGWAVSQSGEVAAPSPTDIPDSAARHSGRFHGIMA
jgi:hypothetical protein